MALLHKDIVDKKGRVTIPGGYQWCMECAQLTPHEKVEWAQKCVVCGNNNHGYNTCPECGWEIPEQDNGPLHEDIAIHAAGCHNQTEEMGEDLPIWHQCQNQNMRVADAFFDHNKPLHVRSVVWAEAQLLRNTDKCWCPKARVFRCLNQFGHWSHSVFSMECSNAQEWGWSTRCPICATIFEVDDGNC